MSISTMLFSIVSLAVVALLALYAYRSIALGASRGIWDLESSLQQVYALADPRLSLIVRQKWGRRFLQFRTRSHQGLKTIELWFPKDGWNVFDYPSVVKYSIRDGLHRKEFCDTEGNAFLIVSFGEDTKVAADFASEVLIDLFGMRAEEKVKVRLDVHAL